MQQANSSTNPINGRIPKNLKIAELNSYPLQGTFYSTSDPEKIRMLADNIQRNGLMQPVEVMPAKNNAGLPSNTILDGHDRVEAVKTLGWETIHVIVRQDLALADPAAVEKE